MSKLDIPVYIISLNKKHSFNFDKYFNNVNIVEAIDVRNDNPVTYYNKNIITARALYDLQNGRKDHYGFGGIGAIGLYLTYKKLAEQLKDITQNVLICEDDCLIDNMEDFTNKIHLLKNNNNFDCAIFGSIYKKNEDDLLLNQFNESNNIQHINKNKNNDKLSQNFITDKLDFILLHSVVWSPNGIKKLRPLLDKPIEVQLDAYLSLLSKNNQLNVLLETKNTTSQSVHVSDLKNDMCPLCNIQAKDPETIKNYIISKLETKNVKKSVLDVIRNVFNKENFSGNEINYNFILLLLIIIIIIYSLFQTF